MKLSNDLSVLWREGMFLAPQHMQAFAREIDSRISHSWPIGMVGEFGFLSLELDREALERDVFSIVEAEAVFPDGTHAEFPATADVPQREFKELFTGTTLPVYLGIPAARSNVPQIENGEVRATRYLVEARPTPDENLRDSQKEVEFRRLRGCLFFGDEDRSDFECLQVATLVRRGKPEVRSVLSTDYVPPVLACGASRVLTRALGEIAREFSGQARDLAARVPPTSSLSSIEKGADIGGFVKLQALNSSVLALTQLAELPGLHPFEAYRTLLDAIGRLAIFGAERVVPDLPSYDHDDLSRCFSAAIEVARELAQAEVSVPYDAIAFVKDPEREGFLRCELPAEWTGRQVSLYLAVEIDRPAEEVPDLVAKGVKLVAEADVERVLQGVVPGIGLLYERKPPLSFPHPPGLHYFRIETEGASREHWLRMLEDRTAVVLSTLAAQGAAGFQMCVELHDQEGSTR